MGACSGVIQYRNTEVDAEENIVLRSPDGLTNRKEAESEGGDII